MALHHRPTCDDIRSAYATQSFARHLPCSPPVHFSASQTSYQTAPTHIPASMSPPPPSLFQSKSKHLLDASPHTHSLCEKPASTSRLSVDTYSSTIADDDEDLEQGDPDYELPDFTVQHHESNVLPSTPSHFSDLFPSHRTLSIRHDSSTVDGNLNLRIDTSLASHGRNCDMTLFHLRMHDLRNREFSLRRYCRDSGREVCRYSSKQEQPRPRFHQSWSNAISNMKPKLDSRTTIAGLRRNDSGYSSMHSVENDSNKRPQSAGLEITTQPRRATRTVKLEFSNYAHVDIRRTGFRANKRYEFDYWGVAYNWRRIVRQDGTGVKRASYHLTKVGDERPLAFITPIVMSDAERKAEQGKGRWVEPSTMWIADHSIFSNKDVADVVVATGLIALVDDLIRKRFHSKRPKRLRFPMAGLFQ